jgi:tetratricopeptide (TPR) repeat protein
VLDPEAPTLIEGLDVLLSSGLGRLTEMEEGAAAHAANPPALAPELAVPDTVVDRIGAELAFHEGRSAFQDGHVRAALEHLRRAVDLRPDQAAYHAWLGSVLFHLRGAAALPEALDRLEHAVAVDPDSADAHVLLADVLLALGQGPRARGHLERTLALRPEQPAAAETLLGLLREAGDFPESERLCRRLIVALGERAPALRRRLWLHLAALYESALADPAAAARASVAAAALGPDDGA